MRLFRYGVPGQERPALMVSETAAVDISDIVDDITGQVLSPERQAELQRIDVSRRKRFDIRGVRLAPPVARPGKIVCIGLNYRAHAAESAMEEPAEPILFMKAPNSVCGPADDIVLPPGSRHTDYEVELAAVIGAPALYLNDPDEARTVIAGYTISNDVSERSAQLHRGGQWVKGKSFPTFNPLGPWLVTPDEVGDPADLDLLLSVNGTPRQQASTKQMIFDVHMVVSYISRFMKLEPGDIVNTGTPAGVALGHPNDEYYLRDGDEVVATISGLGEQRNHVIDAGMGVAGPFTPRPGASISAKPQGPTS